MRIEFWEETEEEYIFRCIDCGISYPIPIDPDKLHLYPELWKINKNDWNLEKKKLNYKVILFFVVAQMPNNFI